MTDLRSTTYLSNIKRICKEKGVSITALEKGAHLGRRSIYNWDKHTPGAASLKPVAEYLGCTLDELVAVSGAAERSPDV